MAAVSKYIVKEMVSYHTVEKESFKELLQTFDKQYKLPGRKFFTKTAIPDQYNKTRKIIAKDLKAVDCRFDHRQVVNRVGYRNPVPIWHQYLCNRPY